MTLKTNCFYWVHFSSNYLSLSYAVPPPYYKICTPVSGLMYFCFRSGPLGRDGETSLPGALDVSTGSCQKFLVFNKSTQAFEPITIIRYLVILVNIVTSLLTIQNIHQIHRSCGKCFLLSFLSFYSFMQRQNCGDVEELRFLIKLFFSPQPFLSLPFCSKMFKVTKIN